MSRIGRKPVTLPKGVDLEIADGNVVTVKGPRGTLSAQFAPSMILQREDGVLSVERPDDTRQNRSLHGLTRTLINNMVVGVTEGFRKNLEIQGVGYRAALDGKSLVLSVGFSHPVRMTPPDGITYALDGQTRIAVSGSNKQVVGEE